MGDVQEGGLFMSSPVQVRGCCCGIPFGCGVLMFFVASVAVWQLAMADWLPF